MAAVIGALRAVLSLNSAQFEAGLGKAQAKLAGISAKMEGLSSKLMKIGAVMSAASAGVTLAIKGQIDAADQMGQMAQKMGVPVEELSKLAYAAKLSDVSVDSLGTAMKTLSRNMVNTPKMFADLGVAVKAADGSMRPVSEVMADVSDIFAKMPDGAAKTALAMKLFGKAGQDMIPMLNSGKAGLKGMMDEAERMGLVVTPAMSEAANNFNDNLDRLTAIAGGFALQVATVLTPALKSFSDKLVGISQWFAQLTDLQRQWAAWVAGIIVVAGPVLLALGAVIGALKWLVDAIIVVASVVTKLTPLGWALTAIAAAAYLVWTNWDWLKTKFSAIMTAISTAASTAWTAITDKVQDTIYAIQFKWELWKQTFNHLLLTVPQLFIDLWEKVKAVAAQWVQDFINIGGQIVDGLKKGITEKWDAMLEWFNGLGQGMIDGWNDIWDTHSPSKVTEELGVNIMSGLQIGLEGGISGVASAMDRVTDTLKTAGEGWTDVFSQVGSTIKSAFVNVVTGKGSGLKAGLSSLLGSFANKAAGNAFDFLAKALGFAKGGVFAGGNLVPFAAGGIVSQPTIFPMARGTGLMGEAGPEAIMPLTRGAGGRLGVANHGRVGVGFDASTGDLTVAMYDAASQIVEQKRLGIVRQSVGAVQAGSRKSKTFLG